MGVEDKGGNRVQGCNPKKNPLWLFGLVGVILLKLTGCSGIPASEGNGVALEPPFSSDLDRFLNVSGMWEYREGEVVYDLLLDRQGNGTYDWQQGRFETAVLTQGQWKGTWVQVGNDREGGFEARLGGDGLSARGRWWYTRLGNDTDTFGIGRRIYLATQRRARGNTCSGRRESIKL